MKFTLNNDHQANRLMNTLLSGLLLFTLLFLTADLIAKALHFGLTPEAVKTALFGDEEAFIDPLPFASLLESVHADIFFTMMTLLTLGAIYGRVGRSKRWRLILINVMMLSALVALAAPLLAYYVAAFWADVWYAAFILWHLTALLVTLIALWRLRFP